MSAEYENRPLSHPQVAAIELVAEVMAKGEVDPNADTFYGRLCEVTCEVTSLTRQDPDATLFQVPQDFIVKDAPARHRS